MFGKRFFRRRHTFDDNGGLIDVTLLFEIVVAVWILLFVASRYYHFVYGLTLAREQIKDSADMARACLANPDLRRIEPDVCKRHMAVRDMDPKWLALEYVVEHTYLCGYDTCASVLGSLSTQLGYLFLGIGAVLAGLFFFYRYLRNRGFGPAFVTYDDSRNGARLLADSADSDEFGGGTRAGSARQRSITMR